MDANLTPNFPVIWLGDKCGLMHFQDQEPLFTTELKFWGPLQVFLFRATNTT